MDGPPTPHGMKRNISITLEGKNTGSYYSCARAAEHHGSGLELDTEPVRPRREPFAFVADLVPHFNVERGRPWSWIQLAITTKIRVSESNTWNSSVRPLILKGTVSGYRASRIITPSGAAIEMLVGTNCWWRVGP